MKKLMLACFVPLLSCASDETASSAAGSGGTVAADGGGSGGGGGQAGNAGRNAGGASGNAGSVAGDSGADSDDDGGSDAGGLAKSIYWGAVVEGTDTYAGLVKPDAGHYANPPWDLDTWDLFEQHAGKKVSLLPLGSAWWRCENGCGYKSLAYYQSVMEVVRNRGAIPLFTWSSTASGDANHPDSEFQLADIARGDHDAFLQQFATDAKAYGHPFFLRFDWEMNGSWYPWSEQTNGNRPGEYAAMWRHVHDIFTQVGATNVTWVWCPNTDYAGATALAGLYPGDAYVDWMCLDGYNFGTNPLQPVAWRTFTQVVKATYDQLVQLAPARPIMIGETASTEIGGSKSVWITETLTAELPAFARIRAVTWFNWNIYENGGQRDWAIETSASAQDAFKRGIGSAYYQAGSVADFTDLPLLQPIGPVSR
jgi:hypothetical protein